MPSQATRKKMYLEYMDILCHDETGAGFKLDPVEHFIAKQKDKQYRGDVQGCSRFNPILLLSSDEDTYYNEDQNKDARNELYAPDRRVLIYIFEHDSEVDPGAWPCPEARSGAATCRKRFWSDSDRRLKPGDDRREFKDKQDTMACRFYHGFAHNSPCETGGRLWIVRFQVDAGKPLPVPLRNRRYVLSAGSTADAPVIRGTLDAKGEIRIPVFDEKTTMTLKIDARDPGPPPKDGHAPTQPAMNANGEYPDENLFFAVTLDAGSLGDPTDDVGAKQRLYNLGYGSTAPDSWQDDETNRAVKGYRTMRKMGDGDLDASKDAIRQEHELTDVPAEDPDAPGPVAGSSGGGSGSGSSGGGAAGSGAGAAGGDAAGSGAGAAGGGAAGSGAGAAGGGAAGSGAGAASGGAAGSGAGAAGGGAAGSGAGAAGGAAGSGAGAAGGGAAGSGSGAAGGGAAGSGAGAAGGGSGGSGASAGGGGAAGSGASGGGSSAAGSGAGAAGGGGAAGSGASSN